MTETLSDVRQISKLAYGFMASKALFAALEIGLFGHVAKGANDLAALSAATGVPENRLSTLVAALVSTGVLDQATDGGLANSPAAAAYLDPAAPAFFGEYYRLQIGRQIYRDFEHLHAGLMGDRSALAHQQMSDWLSDPQEAADFSNAQHAGSLGPAMMLSKRLDLSQDRRLLDVAGGTGAYSIVFCRANPDLRATILDFQTVIDVARGHVEASGVADRIDLLPGDARATDWPAGQDVVFMSYLISAVARGDIAPLLAHALETLRPGGRVIVHDFMLNEARTGPFSAAMFFTSYLTNNPEAVSFSPSVVERWLTEAGFVRPHSEVMIPDITMMTTAEKPEDA